MTWCPVVAPRMPSQAPCSGQAATQPAALEPGPSTPPPAKCSKHTEGEQAAEPAAEPTQPTKGKGKAAIAKPAPQPGRWVEGQGAVGRLPTLLEALVCSASASDTACAVKPTAEAEPAEDSDPPSPDVRAWVCSSPSTKV
ncbi:hypothetical protein HaLaN_10589 [Haematococcus lacustris]|uniref:Uncharacterized protein n=1 Tax=Haematococcus lacustris TaxID=44745 RepID=A0A699Z5Y7_HAELA|nr:hypothetical protein HaLaN_10589 [Haematococcus lacustris]